MHRGFMASVAGAGIAVALWGCTTVHKTVSTEPPAPPPAAAPAPKFPVAAPPRSANAQSATASATSRTHINQAGLEIIKQSEGHNLAPYQDGGHWFVGYGHAIAAPGPAISEEEAVRLLREDVSVCEQKVDAAAKGDLSSNEFSAMVSLCYNIGWKSFAASSVVAELNMGNHPGAADAFLKFTKVTINGVRQELPRLRARREKERALFLKPDAPAGA